MKGHKTNQKLPSCPSQYLRCSKLSSVVIYAIPSFNRKLLGGLLLLIWIWTFPRVVSLSFNPSLSSALPYECSVVAWVVFVWPASTSMSSLIFMWHQMWDVMLGTVWAGSFQGPSPEGACLNSKPTARQAELAGERERVPWLGLASAFCHTLELSDYVHPGSPFSV